jgi:hypothetical protein
MSGEGIRTGTILLLDTRSADPGTYVASVVEGVIEPLRGFDRLGLLVHADQGLSLGQRQEERAAWKAALDEWRVRKRPPFGADVFCDVDGTPVGCCEDWNKNIWRAFQDPEGRRIIYLPYDIMFMLPPAAAGAADPRLQAFIDRCNRGDADLLLGTYESTTAAAGACENNFLVPTALSGEGRRKDIPKNMLEDFTVLELWIRFPETMRWFVQGRTDRCHPPKPRTGFFGLGRGLYELFYRRKGLPNMLPWEGTVQLLICARMFTEAGMGDFKVAEHFVADLDEPRCAYDAYRVGEQRIRAAFVIAVEALWWSRNFPKAAR